jgi:hypothetical protein
MNLAIIKMEYFVKNVLPIARFAIRLLNVLPVVKIIFFCQQTFPALKFVLINIMAIP